MQQHLLNNTFHSIKVLYPCGLRPQTEDQCPIFSEKSDSQFCDQFPKNENANQINKQHTSLNLRSNRQKIEGLIINHGKIKTIHVVNRRCPPKIFDIFLELSHMPELQRDF